jgi:hypothetical protein
MSQGVRLNNMLFNHGPGSILETMQGPVIIQQWGEIFQNLNSYAAQAGAATSPQSWRTRFEIYEERLAQQMMMSPEDKVRFHTLPSSEGLELKQNQPVVQTTDFPRYLICLKGGSHPNDSILFEMGKNERCPECHKDERTSPIRFVGACNAGHLSDLPWYHMITHNGKKCRTVFKWNEISTSINGIKIECKDCGEKTTLAQGRHLIGKCIGQDLSGTVPDDPNACDRSLELVLRSSTSVWQSHTRTAVTIPDDSIVIALKKMQQNFPHGIQFEQKSVMSHIRPVQCPALSAPCELPGALDILTGVPGTVIPFPEGAGAHGRQDPASWNLIQLLHWFKPICGPEYNRFIKPLREKVDDGSLAPTDFYKRWDGYSNPSPVSTVEAMKNEYSALFETSKNRAQAWPDGGSAPLFRKSGPLANRHGLPFTFGSGASQIELRIHEVSKLRTVTALHSFTRPVKDRIKDNRPVPVDLSHRGQYGARWYGAAEAQGEGILITFADNMNLNMTGERWQRWESTHRTTVDSSSINNQFMYSALRGRELTGAGTLSDEELLEIHPMFVWWHTLTHQLIRTIQHDTGYSSSAISERIYATKKSDGSWTGGVLLYVTEGGMDGTLGGLTALARNMQKYLNSMEKASEVCSNDPLCSEVTSSSLEHDRGCYSCCYNSETSCRHFNLSLDRILLRECVGLS